MRTGEWIGTAIFALFVSAALLCAGSVSAEETTADQNFYLYQHGGFGSPGDLTIETESAYGTRETRLLGENAFEQALRARVSGAKWLSFELWGGVVFNDTSDDEDEEAGEEEEGEAATPEEVENADEEDASNGAFSADVFFKVLRQDKQAINLSLAPGYLYDYQGTSIPRVQLVVDRSWDKFDLSFTTLAEMPINGEEEEEEEAEAEDSAYVGTDGDEEAEEEEEEEGAYDEVDLIFSLAASYGVADWSRLGVEAVLEDTEGLWEEEEAEGGAKTVIGPTAAFTFLENFHARLNAGAVIPVTTNDQTRVAGGSDPNKSGFLGRAAIGYRF